jgi:hypothetical protein
MDTASLSELKKELQTIPQKVLIEHLLRVAKYKKENKELLSYLLFESHDEQGFISSVQQLMDTAFDEINDSNSYLAKKSVRKILRTVTKYIKFSGKKETEIELLIHFCRRLKEYDLVQYRNIVLLNIYDRQLSKIGKSILTLHEDLQYDYQQMLAEL